ncbi:MAG: carbohydrate porin [Opitutales bacterium]
MKVSAILAFGIGGLTACALGWTGAVAVQWTLDGSRAFGGSASGEAGWVGELMVNLEADQSLTDDRSVGVFALLQGIASDGAVYEAVGDFHGFSNLAAEDALRVFEAGITLSDTDGAWTASAGLLAADSAFMALDPAGLFLNAEFGPLGILTGNTPSPVWPVGAPGVHGHLELANGLSFQAGLYDGDAGDERPGGLSRRLAVGGDAGFLTIAELGGSLANGAWTLGAFSHSGAFPRLDNPTGTGGITALYGQWAVSLTPDLSGFVRAGTAGPDERVTARWTVDGGFTWQGDAWGRPSDQWGTAFAYTAFSDAWRAAAPDRSAGEWLWELTYAWQVSERLLVQPDLQWIPETADGGGDVWIASLRLQLSL